MRSPTLQGSFSNPSSPFSHQTGPEHPIWARLPLQCPSTCLLDDLLIDLVRRQRQRVTASVGTTHPMMPETLSLARLIDPSLAKDAAKHPICSLLTDVISKFPDISQLPERVAVLYIMFGVLRWLVCPCRPCYEHLPDWIRPVQQQFDNAHPLWLTVIPWPVMRRCISQGLTPGTRIKFDDFFVPYLSLSLNWPYPAHTAIIQVPDIDPEKPSRPELNPAYEAHLRDLANWSLGADFLKEFPEICDATVRIQEAGGTTSNQTSPETQGMGGLGV